MGYEKLIYQSQALSLEAQIQHLKSKGILVQDPAFATECLTHVGLYRLLAYVRPLLRAKSPAEFEAVWNLYTFDRALRILTLDAVERIEIAFRVAISEVMSLQYDSHWYINPKYFVTNQRHIDFMDKVITLARIRSNAIIKHYYNTYSEPEYPPSWMVIECLTFGTWSKVFDNLKNRQDKKAIASRLGQPLRRCASWILSLTDVRNLCAHHERLWNYRFPYQPQDAPTKAQQRNRFYQQAYIITELLKFISPQSTWKNDLKKLIEAHSPFPIEQMGFFAQWENDPFWNS